MFGSDPKKTLCMKGNQNRNPGQLARGSSTLLADAYLGFSETKGMGVCSNGSDGSCCF